MGLIRLLMFQVQVHTSWLRHLDWSRMIGRPAFPSVDGSRRLSRPWPRLLWLGTGLSAFDIGRPAFPAIPAAVDGYLAHWQLTRRRTEAGGNASAAWLRLLSLSLLFGPGFGFCGTTVMVVLPRHEPLGHGLRDYLSLQT